MRSDSQINRQTLAGLVESEEALLFHFRKGLELWHARLRREDYQITDTLKGLVLELVVMCAEFVRSGEPEPPREVHRLGAEIGRRLLERTERQKATYIFRDLLLRCLLEELKPHPEVALRITSVFFVIGDAIWECYAERLRSSLRQEKRQRLVEQLRVAKRIQQHLLPKSIPQIPGFDFAGRLVPAEEVGGDYWSIKSYPQDGVVTMKLADITGHGIAAASLVAAVKFISGGFYRGAASPEEVMTRTNHVLVKETPSDILVTMIYGWLYPESRRIRLVNAGHFPVFIAGLDGFRDVRPTGPLMGLEESVYSETEERLAPGEILVFTSDGIVEAGADRPFGAERLKQVVWENREASAKEIADAVIDALFSYDVMVNDDLSIVVTKSVA